MNTYYCMGVYRGFLDWRSTSPSNNDNIMRVRNDWCMALDDFLYRRHFGPSVILQFGHSSSTMSSEIDPTMTGIDHLAMCADQLLPAT